MSLLFSPTFSLIYEHSQIKPRKDNLADNEINDGQFVAVLYRHVPAAS